MKRLTFAIASISTCLALCCTSVCRAAPLRPLVFEPEPRPAEYVSQGARDSLHLTRSGIELSGKDQPLIRLALVAALPVDPQGADVQTSVSNYFLGNDSSKWRTGVANYGKVRYAGVYPGIDLVVYGSEQSFEYDFVVAPHADASRIRMRFDGAKNLSLNAAGDLLIGEGGLMQRRPRVFQENREIAGSFRIQRDRSVSFELGSYDHSQPLTIDPVIAYLSYLGGNAADFAEKVTVDAAGNVYVAGFTTSSDFPGSGVFGQRPNRLQFGFVSKYAPITSAKAQLLYTIFLGDQASPIGGTIAYGVTTDASGNLIVTGLTSAAGFPTRNAVQPQLGGGLDCTIGDAQPSPCPDGFVTKFAPDGRTLIFSTFYGGSKSNYFFDVAVDSAGGIYAVGEAIGPTDLNGTPNAFQTVANAVGELDMVAVRFDPAGKLLYATYLGGSRPDIAFSVAVEKPGVVWIGGTTGSTDIPLPAVNNGLLKSFVGTVLNAYIARLDMNQSGASGLTYATYFTGTNTNSNTSLVKVFLDPSGQVVFCGSTISNIPLTANRMQDFGGVPASRVTVPNFIAGDAYIARLNPAVAGLPGLTYSSYVGGSDSDYAGSCGMDSKGNFVVTGNTYSTDLFLVGGSPIPFKLTTGSDPTNQVNVFLLRLDPTRAGGKVDSFLQGGSDTDAAYAMAIDPASGFAYVVGQTFSKQFPTTQNAQQRSYGGDNLSFDPAGGRGDAFLMQVDLNSIQAPGTQLVQEGGDFQFGSLGSALAAPIAVHIADAQGNPLNLSGYPIRFTATNAIVVPNIAFTDGSGVAGANVRLTGGDATIIAAVDISGFKSYTFHAKAISGTLPNTVAIVSGDKQSGKAGAALSQPLLVELRDANNAPLALAGLTVQFKAANAAVAAPTAVTDATGRASTIVTLGTQAGPSTVQVIVGSLSTITASYTITSPAIGTGGVVSAATFKGGAISPGLIVTVFGANIGPAALAINAAGGDGKFSTVLAATRVLFDGIAGAMIYASSGQTSAIVPYEVAGKTTTLVTVEYQGVTSTPQTVAVTDAQLGLFSANASGSGQGAILNQDNSVNSAANPAKRNSIVILFGTGEGQTDPPGVNGQLALSVYPKPKAPITAKINGITADVLYYGAAPTLVAGVVQINIKVPAGAVDGDATVQLFEGSNQSPATITVAVKGDQ